MHLYGPARDHGKPLGKRGGPNHFVHHAIRVQFVLRRRLAWHDVVVRGRNRRPEHLCACERAEHRVVLGMPSIIAHGYIQFGLLINRHRSSILSS